MKTTKLAEMAKFLDKRKDNIFITDWKCLIHILREIEKNKHIYGF